MIFLTRSHTYKIIHISQIIQREQCSNKFFISNAQFLHYGAPHHIIPRNNPIVIDIHKNGLSISYELKSQYNINIVWKSLSILMRNSTEAILVPTLFLPCLLNMPSAIPVSCYNANIGPLFSFDTYWPHNSIRAYRGPHIVKRSSYAV